MFKKYQLRYYNYRLIVLLLIMSVIGVLVINSAKDSSYALKQCIGLGISLVILIIVSLIDYNWILKFYWLIYIVNLLLLLIVKIFGSEHGGAKRWIGISDSLSIQPSEFAKVFLILFTAKVVSMYRKQLNTWKFLAVLATLLLIPIGLVYLQPNLSTTLLTCMILFTVIYCAGLSYRIIGIACATLIILVGIIAIDVQQENPLILRPYQVKRIMSFVNSSDSDSKVGKEQQDYSVQAIGSGQLYGKGLNTDDPSSVKNGNYIAEVQNDFIFAVIGEELGFTGGCIVIFLYALIIFECILAAIKAKDFTGRLICCGMASLIAYQTFINIGVATQALPNTGVPLPFISSGLSSLVALFGGMGVVINISLQRNSYDND